MFCPLFMTCPLFGMSAIGKFHCIHQAQLCLFRNIQQHHSRPEACNFIKKGSLTQVFSCTFCEISRNTFFTEHLRTTASEYMCYELCFLKVFYTVILQFIVTEVFFKEKTDFMYFVIENKKQRHISLNTFLNTVCNSRIYSN